MISRIVGILHCLSLSLCAVSLAMSPESFSDLTDTMRGFQESRVLLTAVELDIFTAVGQGATGAEVSKKLQTNARATEVLLNALVALGALTKANGTFYNTSETARYLVAGSPDYARPALMHTVHMFQSWATLTDCVRVGTAVIPVWSKNSCGIAVILQQPTKALAATYWASGLVLANLLGWE